MAVEVNKKLVKIYGAGGYKGLPSYGTGILVSPKGHILTINNHIVSTQDIRVHVYDGRLYRAKLVSREPELDMAMLRIEEDVDFLPHFVFKTAAAAPMAEPGDFALAFSNCFQIANRDEPMTMQRGVIAAQTDLRGRIGIFDAPFGGEVYFIDTVTNNPGSAGGAITNRKGDLLGVIGRKYKNKLSDTWINYAIPIQSTVEILREEKPVKVSMSTFVDLSIINKYRQGDDRDQGQEGQGRLPRHHLRGQRRADDAALRRGSDCRLAGRRQAAPRRPRRLRGRRIGDEHQGLPRTDAPQGPGRHGQEARGPKAATASSASR